MNIYEFLNMPSRGTKVTQLVKHFDEVPESRKEYPYYGQVKKDGVHCIVVVDKFGSVGLFSRTGKAFTNVEHIKALILHNGWPEGVYMAELCCDKCSLEVLSGIVNPNRKKGLDIEQLHYLGYSDLFIFDFLSVGAFKAGLTHAPYKVRHRLVRELIGNFANVLPYQLIWDEEQKAAFTKKCIDDGEEGAVYKHVSAPWVAGHKGWHQMKEVRGVHYDLECIGYEEGEGKYAGKVANLLFKWKDGKTIKAMLGKGWTHDDAEEMYNIIKDFVPHFTNVDIVGNPIGAVFHVYALQESSKGKLRLPKVGEKRIDKVVADV